VRRDTGAGWFLYSPPKFPFSDTTIGESTTYKILHPARVEARISCQKTTERSADLVSGLGRNLFGILMERRERVCAVAAMDE
jgi:hypothetical protein